MGSVVTDETGLHAEECECPTCEAGYKPTPLERAAARRALAIRRADEAKRAAAAAAKDAKNVKPQRPRLEPPRKVTLPTQDEWDELQRLRKEMFK